jgi:hypothetical protein
MTFEEQITHSLEGIKTSIIELQKSKDSQETEMQHVITSLESINSVLKDLVTKVDGDDKLDVTGLRKRVAYLESRDKWLKKNWMYAVGAVGGITIIYAILKAVDFLISMYHNVNK